MQQIDNLNYMGVENVWRVYKGRALDSQYTNWFKVLLSFSPGPMELNSLRSTSYSVAIRSIVMQNIFLVYFSL